MLRHVIEGDIFELAVEVVMQHLMMSIVIVVVYLIVMVYLVEMEQTCT